MFLTFAIGGAVWDATMQRAWDVMVKMATLNRHGKLHLEA